jgi:Transcription initiation factor IID, 31kD subunit
MVVPSSNGKPTGNVGGNIPASAPGITHPQSGAGTSASAPAASAPYGMQPGMPVSQLPNKPPTNNSTTAKKTKAATSKAGSGGAGGGGGGAKRQTAAQIAAAAAESGARPSPSTKKPTTKKGSGPPKLGGADLTGSTMIPPGAIINPNLAAMNAANAAAAAAGMTASGGAKRKKPISSGAGVKKVNKDGKPVTSSGGKGGASSAGMGTKIPGGALGDNKGGSGGVGGNIAGGTSIPTAQDAINEKARLAMNDLRQQRADAEYKRSDPLWYSIEDVLLYSDSGGINSSAMFPSSWFGSNSTNSILPEQATIVENALRYNGLSRSDVTPQAMVCLLEQSRRYAVELLEDAEKYAVSVSADDNDEGDSTSMYHEYPVITTNDLLLAVELRDGYRIGSTHSTLGGMTGAMSHQLPKLNIVAQQINRIPLPPIPSYCYSGIVLPSDPNYQLQHQRNKNGNATNFKESYGGGGSFISDEANQTMSSSMLLTARTYDIISATQTAQKMVQPFPLTPAVVYQQRQQQILAAASSSSSSKKKKDNSSPGYGANRGRQIAINLKSNNSTTNTLGAVGNSTSTTVAKVNTATQPTIVAGAASSTNSPSKQPQATNTTSDIQQVTTDLSGSGPTPMDVSSPSTANKP